MITLSKETKKQLIEYSKTKGICLEGNILKVIDSSNDPEFELYIKTSIEKDTDIRRKRLEMTKQVQEQNHELIKSKAEKDEVNQKLQEALYKAEKAKETAINDLDILQKKTQFELIGSIVKVALWTICGIGLITTSLFSMCLILGIDNQIIESAWNNMFGILLTNCFSIIGTIMGVKYASGKNSKY